MTSLPKVTVDSKQVSVLSPYHPDFVTKARKLSGKFDRASNAWTFDARDEERVRKLCRKVYGTDGDDEFSKDLVDIQVRFPSETYDRECHLYIAGQLVARAFGRDGGAKLGEGIVMLKGDVTSGGSMKNPALVIRAGTVFELRDIPRSIAGRELEAYGVNGRLVGQEWPAAEPEPAPEEAEAPTREVLRLRIELGNAAMQTAEDLAHALRKVAENLESRGMPYEEVVTIRDLNGNTVGDWIVNLEPVT